MSTLFAESEVDGLADPAFVAGVISLGTSVCPYLEFLYVLVKWFDASDHIAVNLPLR